MQAAALVRLSTYGYDAATGAVMSIKENAVFGGVGHYVADRTYTPNAVGNVTSLTMNSVLTTDGTQKTCCAYDGLRQLTRAWTPNAAIACDATPSATAMGGTGPASAGPGSYTYDAAGNMTGRPGQTITFNEVGEVSKVVAGSVTQDTVYNVDGSILLRKNTSEGSTLFVGDTVLSQAAGPSVIAGVRTYSGAEGKPIAEKSAKIGTAGTTLTWVFSNLEGTVDVQTVANAAGTTTRTIRDPYGAPIGSSGVWASGTGYMNKPATASTGLTTVGARTYDPVLGKFLSVDPVIDTNLPQQNTGYTYSGNNPTTYNDPTGLKFAIDMADRSPSAWKYDAGFKMGSKYDPMFGKKWTFERPKLSGAKSQLAPSRRAVEAPSPWAPPGSGTRANSASADSVKHIAKVVGDISTTTSNVVGATVRAIRNLPLSAIGGIVGFTQGASCQGYEWGLLLCSSRTFPGTMTLGNVIITDYSHADFAKAEGLSAHEESHATQSAVLGNDLYAVTWLAGLGVSSIFGQNSVGGGGCLNPIERSAAPGGGYERC